MNTLNRFKTVVADCLGISEDEINLGSLFLEDLKADDFDMIEIACEVEEEFGILLNDEEWDNVKNVKDGIKLVKAKLND